jgi:NADPH-dependent FMN reductase
MLKIAIIIGSTRPGRKGEAVGKWTYDIARKRNDAEFELVDVADFNLPHSTAMSLSRLSTTTALAPLSKTPSIFCTMSGPTKRRDSSLMEGPWELAP